MWWAKYVGIPFKELGRDRSGCDCWGLVRLVYNEELGIDLPSWDSHQGPKDHDTIRYLLSEAVEVFREVDSPKEFRIALFKSPVSVLHVGVVINDVSRMLHSSRGRDTCVEPIAKHTNVLKGFYIPV